MKNKEQGRSTLEIIGVLAVLVFLTIGGLQVYSSIQSSLIAAHLEEDVLKEATIKKHENAKADDTDAHKVSRQGAHNTTITSQNGTEGTEQDLFWVTINDINVTAEQKVCQKLLASPKIREQEWLRLMAIEVDGKIVENCPEEIQTITYYFEKRKTLNLKDILLPHCQNTMCPTYATCENGKITTCEAGYKISSNECQCEKCTGRFICDGTKDSQECPEGTKPNDNHTQCDDCAEGEKDALCCPNGSVVSKEKDCDCEGNSDCPSDFVCDNSKEGIEKICTCDQAECPLCKDESKKCWDADTQTCVACPSNPSEFTTQDTCEQNGFQWCKAVEECKLKTDECPECDEHTDCSNATPKCNTDTQTCEACPDETPNWNESTSSCVQCTDNSHCSSGQVCDTTTNTCVGCGAGYRTTETGCEICPIGTYSSDGLECLSCPVNTYSNTEGASECTECDLRNSYYTETEGSTECTYCDTGIQCTKEDFDCTWQEYVCVKYCVNYLTDAGIVIKDESVSDETKYSNSELKYNGDLVINNDVNMHGCNLTVNGTLEIQKDKRFITEGTITINQSSTGSGLLNLGEIQAESLNINKTTGGCENDYIYAAFRNEGTATIKTIIAKSSGHEAGSGGLEDCPVDIYNTGTIESNEIKTEGTNKDSSGIYMKGGKITASNITSTVQHTPIYIRDGIISADSINCFGNEKVSVSDNGRIEANNFTIDKEGLSMLDEGVVVVKEELKIENGNIGLQQDAQLLADFGSITVTGGSTAGVSMQGSSKMTAKNLTSTNHNGTCLFLGSGTVEITGETKLLSCTYKENGQYKGNGIYASSSTQTGSLTFNTLVISGTGGTPIVSDYHTDLTAGKIVITSNKSDYGIKWYGDIVASEINVDSNKYGIYLDKNLKEEEISSITADIISIRTGENLSLVSAAATSVISFKEKFEANGKVENSGTMKSEEGILKVSSGGIVNNGWIDVKNIFAKGNNDASAIELSTNSSIKADVIVATSVAGVPIKMNATSNSPYIKTNYLKLDTYAENGPVFCLNQGAITIGETTITKNTPTIFEGFTKTTAGCQYSDGDVTLCTDPYCGENCFGIGDVCDTPDILNKESF